MAKEKLSVSLDSRAHGRDATFKKSRRNSLKHSADGQAKGDQPNPGPKLSEIDFLLSIWQADCAELKEAGIEMQVKQINNEEGKTCICLVLTEVGFCQNCQKFHSTREIHECISNPICDAGREAIGNDSTHND